MAEQSFEAQIERLEEIVQLLERSEASLADSLKLFEEGTRLAGSLNQLLDEAEQTVTILRQTEQGELVEQPFTVQEER